MAIGESKIPFPTLPTVDHEGQVVMQPESVLRSRAWNGIEVQQVLIQWTNYSPEIATWKNKSNIKANYTYCIHEVKDIFLKTW